jgi:hypothetical protein
MKKFLAATGACRGGDCMTKKRGKLRREAHAHFDLRRKKDPEPFYLAETNMGSPYLCAIPALSQNGHDIGQIKRQQRSSRPNLFGNVEYSPP